MKTRRQVLESLALGGAAALAGSSLARAYPVNERLRLGLIGCGGRMQRALHPKVRDLPGVEVVAACDIYRPHRERLRAELAKSGGEPFITDRYEALLARPDLDAVLIGTPDHWHVPIAVAACEARKDVYVEKPLTHDLEEGKRIIRAQNEHGRIVQVGTQQRSMPQFERAREIIRSGRLGEVLKVHMSWNRNATPLRPYRPKIAPEDFDWKRFLGGGSGPARPGGDVRPARPGQAEPREFDPYVALGNWRWYWDFGAGILGDLMVHWLDAVNWILDLPLPTRAVTVGANYQATWWETPDTIQTILEYPENRLQIHFEGTFLNQHRKAGVTFFGTDATLYADRGRYELTPEPRKAGKAESFVPGRGQKGADFDVDGTKLHLENWIACVRSRKRPVAPAEAGVVAADAAHLANRALPGRDKN